MNFFFRPLLCLLLGLVFASTANAENMKKIGNLDVHYMAIGATFLTPEIAKAYGIERSRYNGLVNISVLDNSQKNTPAKTVVMMGKARNDLGQIKSLEFREVKEGMAVYYLAQIKYSHEETIHFDIDIIDGSEKHKIKFSQKFYVD
ncbi:DUF4426 domain-containing protein [Thalassomonas haliotis]|uniref:DUF4426 domain-containing protein n=1 Tax=Thalassomonas haliotis TaxID=485448 RepID=A0ABY7VBI8_9GAMM|nr:DUF4426 domain-containing protein [Thalassomonas haliotis]WDE10671.1 DUF4426 domain-containing protein [Thalassomonas haliotis]